MIQNLILNQFSKALKNLSNVLDKGDVFAKTKKIETEVLLQSRLAPDQFHLIRQVQIACDTVKLGIARLCGKEAPVYEDNEKSLPDLKNRIERTLAYLETFSEKDFVGFETRKVTTPRWEGKYLTGEEYLIQHIIPNLYFHITTAYSILRNNGVDVGKKDYLGEMPYKK